MKSANDPRRPRDGSRALLQGLAAKAIVGALAVAVIVPRLPGLQARGETPSVGGEGALQTGSFSMDTPPVETLSATAVASIGCQHITTYLSEPAFSLKTWVGFSDAFVRGTVVAVSEGRWATVDGSRPAGNISASSVYRVATVRIASLGKTPPTSASKLAVAGTISVRLVGGTIGCSTYTISPQAPVSVGQDQIWLLMTKPQPPLKAAPSADFDVVDNWPIQNGFVMLPDGSQMTPANVLSASMSQ